MTEYVAGFYFNEDFSQVALIQKQRPSWQKGKLNAIGGKIEDGEAPKDAMVREFKEESGVDTNTSKWVEFLELSGYDFKVYFYKTVGPNINELIGQEDELIYKCYVNTFGNQDVIPNLRWIIPMALENSEIVYLVKEF